MERDRAQHAHVAMPQPAVAAASAEAFVLSTLRTSRETAAHALKTKLVGKRVMLDRRPHKRSEKRAAGSQESTRTAGPRRAIRAATHALALESVTFEQLQRQNALWQSHAKSALAGLGGLEQLAQALQRLDRHGCWLRAIPNSSNALSTEGIVLLETRHTFVLVSERRRVRVLKKDTVFELRLPGDGEAQHVRLRGDQLVLRDR